MSEKKEDVKQEDASSEEEKSTSETEEKTVPYERFSKIVEEKNQYRDEVESLKSKKDTDTKEEETTEDKIKKVLSKIEQEKTEKEKSEQTKFDREVDDIIELNPSVKRADFIKFLKEKAETYGVESVKGGMQLFKDLGNVKEESKKEEKKLPESEGSGDKKTSYDVEGKSMEQIIEESIGDGNLK